MNGGVKVNNIIPVIEQMAQKYNQLYLAPEKGISGTGLYSDIVHYGKTPPEVFKKIQNELSGFKCSKYGRLFTEITPAGKVEILYIYNNSDFERFLQIMAYRGEPACIPDKIETAEIEGITNWRKIEKHMQDYLFSGGDSVMWSSELKNFTNNRQNYQDTLIVIKRSDYSGITYEKSGYAKLLWNDISLKIKIYYACTHYVCRKMYGGCKNIIWNELVADCMGILFALNKYDVLLAKKFLGVSKHGYDNHGRLINYCSETENDLNELAVKISTVIDKMSVQIKKLLASGITDYYNILFNLQERMNTYLDIIK